MEVLLEDSQPVNQSRAQQIECFNELIQEATKKFLSDPKKNPDGRKSESTITGERLEVVRRTRWNSDFYAAQTCMVCKPKRYIGSSWELVFEWGDTQIYAYVPDVCDGCINMLIEDGIVYSAKPFNT